MKPGMDNQKQLRVAGILGIGCIVSVGNAIWQVHAAHSAPAPVRVPTPAASAPAGFTPADVNKFQIISKPAEPGLATANLTLTAPNLKESKS